MFDRHEFNAAMARCGMTQRRLAEILGINESTINRKINRGGDFSRAEINTMIDVMGIEEPAKIFFAK